MLFNFRLTPLEQVVPWGRPNDPHLHWFGLTDGCYWLRVGDVELFHYREDAFGGEYYPCKPYVDYHVVRLWEDWLEILPDVLAPVPQALAEKLAAPNFLAWRARVERWNDAKEGNFDNPIYWLAIERAGDRYLDSGYLVKGPRIWAWNDGTHIHLEWDNRKCRVEGKPIWTAGVGSWVLPVEDFLDEVQAFDTRFIQAMQQRVDQIAADWTRPEIRIDIDQLVREQADRATWLAKTLDRAPQARAVEWNAVLDAVSRIDAETGS